MGSKRATATDIAVGQRIRTFRNNAGLSQTELADQIGVTFQQVQKYEKGTNRVGAGRLKHIASALSVPIAAFFDGVPQPSKRRAHDSSLDELMAQPKAYRLLDAFRHIPEETVQIAVLDFVRCLRVVKRRRNKPINRGGST
jgi:transcriptional regulator with XRE-family HTH domain